MPEPELNLDFLDAGVDLHALDDLSFEGKPTVLERLGPAHFRSKGFSFMGFLQTVYDHVAEQTATKPDPAPAAPLDPTPGDPTPGDTAASEASLTDASEPVEPIEPTAASPDSDTPDPVGNA